MDIRHLRCFLAVAEELHFARAAARLNMEQSPLSRTIRELEEDLGMQLFVRTSRSTRLTLAGRLFLEQARESVKAANGFHGQFALRCPTALPLALAGLAGPLPRRRPRNRDPPVRCAPGPADQGPA